MKKGVLILLGMFMMVSTVEAKNGEKIVDGNEVNYTYNNAVNFIERGIEFYIFTNGDFDFNTHYSDFYYDSNGRRFRNSGIRIDRDYRGRINRVGSVFINYDFRGNVTRIGSVFINYYRNRLTNVGNLTVQYDRWGAPIFFGTVKENYYYHNGVRINLNLGQVCDYNDAYFFKNDFRRNYTQFREDSRYYYYKANRNAKIGKRSKIIKRRKPITADRNTDYLRNRENDSYRKSDTNNTRRTQNDSRRTLENNSRTSINTNNRTFKEANTRRLIDNNTRRSNSNVKEDNANRTSRKIDDKKRTNNTTSRRKN